MRFNRARYVTICQQFLVTAVVVAVGLSAAGVMTLQIVSPEQRVAPAVEVSEAYVATKPVTPKVREIKVAPKSASKSATAPSTHRAGGTQVAAVSAPTAVHGYATVGVTWKSGTKLAEDQIKVQVRTLKNGTWSGWQTAAYHDEHGPDAGSVEASRAQRPGTDPVVIGDVDQVQMRAETTDGTAPEDLELAVIDPGSTDGIEQSAAIDTARLDEGAEGGAGSAATHGDGAAADLRLSAMQTAPKPYIFSRAQWGANESLRDKSSLRYGTIKTGFIHHTVNANSYSEQQVPALIRGIYAYHTQSRGWSDIGYNFLVDRFGRIWEGRYGGVDRPVVGAHTLGYNEYSFAMSAIGNYDVAAPPQAVVDAYAKLFAWKLSLYDIPADATRRYVKDRYLNAINGHRDVGQTACPGKYLYAKIPEIRTLAARIQDGAGLTGDPVGWPIIDAPDGVPNPTDLPLPAVEQPDIDFPLRSNLTQAPWPDLVLKSDDGQISILPLGGMLGFDDPIRSSGTWGGKRFVVALGDVTGDGKGDVLATTASNGYARVYPGDGKGHVVNSGIAGTWRFAHADMILAAGDFDRDGKVDLVSRDRDNHNLYLHRGKGGGVFAGPTLLRRNWPFKFTSITDLDRDGHPDLVTAKADDTLILVRGTGGTTSSTSFARSQALVDLPRTPAAIMAGPDSTGDGKPDVIIRWNSGRASIYAGNGKGALGQEFGQFSSVLDEMNRFSSAQMVGTAATDVVAVDRQGRLVVVPNNGRSNVLTRVTSNLKVEQASQILAVGDWNRNGIPDVMVRDSGGDRLVVYPGKGHGKFGQGRSVGTGWKDVVRLAPVGDVTGDGYPDLVGRVGETGSLRIYPGNGFRGFKANQKAPAHLRTYNQVGADPWGFYGASFGSEDGGFVPLVGATMTAALEMANGAHETEYDSYVGVGDADGDGAADVLAREKETGTLWLLPGKTSGGVQPRMWVADGYAGYQLIG